MKNLVTIFVDRQSWILWLYANVQVVGFAIYVLSLNFKLQTLFLENFYDRTIFSDFLIIKFISQQPATWDLYFRLWLVIVFLIISSLLSIGIFKE